MRYFLLFCLLGVARALAINQIALSPGEALAYRVSWGLFPSAGEIRITART